MTVLFIIIAIALIFEFINGFHDVANVVATPIASKSLSPYQAISLAALFNFIGAFAGTAVATTISQGLVNASSITNIALISALITAIQWNLFTWYFGIPSSSSHALIGAMVGVSIATSNFNSHNYEILFYKVIIPIILSPVLAFCLALIMTIIIFSIVSRINKPKRTNNIIRELQVISSGMLALSHGSNDLQKTVSIITITLFSFNIINNVNDIPAWVIFMCAITMAAGTLAGGMKIIKTLTTRVSKLGPANGFAAEISSGALILCASCIGLPISTTQAATGGIMGAGYIEVSGINWKTVKTMVLTWMITLPFCTITSYITYHILKAIIDIII